MAPDTMMMMKTMVSHSEEGETEREEADNLASLSLSPGIKATCRSDDLSTCRPVALPAVIEDEASHVSHTN